MKIRNLKSKFMKMIKEGLYISYYKLIFRRRVPFGTRIGNYIHSWEKQQCKGDIPLFREVWNSKYSGEFWDVMKECDEVPRYSVIAGYFQYLKDGGSILDIGCGEGILQEKLDPNRYSKYVGVDISDEAIRKAFHKQDDKTLFISGNAADYVLEESFDLIVFNESLYYFDDPFAIIDKYVYNLNKDGIFIISTFMASKRAASILNRLKANYYSLEEAKVTVKSKTWVCNVFSPQRKR